MPLLIYSMAALGLNILVGYCGQVSLGTGGFMAVGAFACYKLMTAFPGMDMFSVVILSGVVHGWRRHHLSACLLFASRDFTLLWQPLPPSSFWFGCSTSLPGSTIIPLPARSPRLNARYSALR